MRRTLLCFAFLACFLANAQEIDVSVTGGFLNLTASAKANVDGAARVTDSQAGFFVGLSSEFRLDEKWAIEPSLLYSVVDGTDYLQLPILPKYYVAENVSFTAGPQLTYAVEDEFDVINNLGLDVSLGLSVDIDEHFFAYGRYALELTDRTSNTDFASLDPFDPGSSIRVKTRLNSLHIGVGYTF